MANSTLNLTEPLYDYLLRYGLREPVVVERLRHATEAEALSEMRSAPEQGQFMGMLLKLIGAKRVIEVGTYTGYATLWMALALPDDGEIITCDICERWSFVAHRFWEEAKVEKKIRMHLGPAIDTLDTLIDARMVSSFDFVFIDADKENYQNYYDRSLELLRPGGLMVIDNVLWGGSVIDAENRTSATEAIRAFNRRLKVDSRVEIAMLPVADGITLVRKL